MPRERKASETKKGELELIQLINSRVEQRLAREDKHGPLVLGIGDDCAVLRPRRSEDLVVTTDLSLENVHFRLDWHAPESVGHRCLARGLSDLAAMGARPVAAFLSLAVPAKLTGRWIERFLDGFLALAGRYRLPLAGGDTADSRGVMCADIVLLGNVPTGKALLRSGAHAGDIVYVTGTLGGAAAELDALARAPSSFRKQGNGLHPHLYPEPRLDVGRALLRRRLATAAIDLSDGLSTDLTHICERSRLAAVIDAQSLPIASSATLQQALHGGEDYELLFTARPGVPIPRKIGGIVVHAIGKMIKLSPRHSPEARIYLLSREGTRTPLAPQGWEHFRS
ncbi:MAG TPA: thiamine-phosphate kinase [Acidobacteriaceae bacterium]|jgi:thiamine-monophosphate kinase